MINIISTTKIPPPIITASGFSLYNLFTNKTQNRPLSYFDGREFKNHAFDNYITPKKRYNIVNEDKNTKRKFINWVTFH